VHAKLLVELVCESGIFPFIGLCLFLDVQDLLVDVLGVLDWVVGFFFVLEGPLALDGLGEEVVHVLEFLLHLVLLEAQLAELFVPGMGAMFTPGRWSS
jgi:hypothetical protein